MSLKSLLLTTTAQAMDETPFAAGFDAVIHNPSGASVTVQQGDTSGGSFTTLATVAAGAYENVTLPPYIKLSAAGTAYVLGSI